MEQETDPAHSPLREGKLVVVVLIGAPGSGKSTFCSDVMAAAPRPWARVCQDTIANGKAGTKLQCLKSAADALREGKSVFIDRCNLEREQRAEFVRLGGAQVDGHAVVLDLPARLCISRSVKRSGHEGNLQGGKAAAVVNRMLQKKELPKLSEGFSRITYCQNENDVKDAVKTYSTLCASDNLPSGTFGQKNPDAKVQLGIMKFLKKIENSDSTCDVNKTVSVANSSLNSVPNQESKEKDPCFMENEKENVGKEVAGGKYLPEEFFCSDVTSNDVHTLAFPSISTSDFQFNHEKASDCIIESVADFLNKVDNLRLVLVDLSHKSNILSLVRTKAAKRNIDGSKFLTHVGDITRLSTEGGLHCNVIANAANWRLKPGGGGVNAAIFNAAGEALEIATKERADCLTPGSSVAIPLPSTSPLYQNEGVTHVIHVLGPNMNPNRPNCLKNDYTTGCKVLRDAYSSLFKNFESIICSQKLQSERKDSTPAASDSHNNPLEGTIKDQPVHRDQKMKREGFHVSPRNKKWVQKNDKIAQGEIRIWNSWALALHQIAMNPEKHKNVVLEISDDIVVLNDLYPKAKRHILVLSRLPGLDALADARKEHLPLLKKMHSAGVEWAEKFLNDDSSLVFRLGYHSVPSLRQLHLHVISQDFDSAHLKNKKHWNSFTTPFFRDSADVLEEIDKQGEVTLKDDEKLLSMELRCHRCKSAHPNIPRLKSHITACKASFPSSQVKQNRLVSASS